MILYPSGCVAGATPRDGCLSERVLSFKLSISGPRPFPGLIFRLPMSQPIAIDDAEVLPSANGGTRLHRRSRRQSRADWSRIRRGWLLSLAVHALAAGVALAAAVWIGPRAGDRPSLQYDLLAAIVDEPPSLLLVLPTLAAEPPQADALAAADLARLSAEAIPPELRAELLDASQRDEERSASGNWVAAQVLDEVSRAERLSPDAQLERLQGLSDQLEHIATPESVAAVTGRLAALLGAADRAEQPAAEPVAGEFDFETAQVHAVRRNEPEPGKFEYVAVLLDAQGRTLEAPLSREEGEQLYKVMELVQSNPLLERVYRGVVMSLLDGMLKPTPAAP